MNRSGEAKPKKSASGVLGLDPNAVLAGEPGFLLDPRFVGTMHAELEAELGAEEGAIVLAQIGLLQGFHDAARAVGGEFTTNRITSGVPLAPSLALRFQLNENADPPGSIEVVGSWPERTEASAHLSQLGPCAHPVCHLSAGYTSGWLSGIMDVNLLAFEFSCSATGAVDCRFVAREVEAWRADGDPRTLPLLDALPFDAVRARVRACSPCESRQQVSHALDPNSAVVNIWGPVMVIPFSGGDEGVRAVEMIGQDPAASEVSVVVVDLSGAILDEAFGALALERVIEIAEAWGAETILAEVSPLSERIVAELERQPLLVEKDLSQAVASAFRIVQAQRSLI